jgi:hypothetical protein
MRLGQLGGDVELEFLVVLNCSFSEFDLPLSSVLDDVLSKEWLKEWIE